MSDPGGSDKDNGGPDGSQPASQTAVSTTTEEKCCYRSCKVRGARLLPCRGPGCDKVVHLICYQAYLLRKFSLPALPGGNAACTKKCLQKAAKELAGGDVVEGSRRGNWDNDQKEDDGRTSMKILLDWWMTEGNYAKFCGKHNDGTKKTAYCASLAETMTRETLSKRDAKNVSNKIQHIERKWREAHNFATSETGAGIQARDGVSSFQEIVKKKCPYYYDLLEIMGDRASSQPQCTNYDDDDNEDGVLSLSDVSDQSNAVSMAATSRRPSVSSTNTSIDPRKRKASPRGDAATTSNHKTKTKRNSGSISPKNGVLLDDKAVNALVYSNKAAEDRMEEFARHNKAMERLEENKQRLEEKKLKSLSWKGKNDELEYKMNLLRKYKEIKTHFGW
eukprot:scaffold8960_cov91-Cylindrotheca_fusiformis.AAC.4